MLRCVPPSLIDLINGVMMLRNRVRAIELTDIGLNSGKDYYHFGVELYRLQGVDGTDYIVRIGKSKIIFINSYDACQFFAKLIWCVWSENEI